ncbi:hypothetical protein [Salinisphaera sp.]|uniref:DUF2515 family protein n=1 Tax=Salinisphaera sp. TaxID=1914330 RepID=UPI0025E3E892|nr:hypothetical protein [Salinisphaera sp.]
MACADLWSIEQVAAIEAQSENNELLPQAIRRAKRTAGGYAALFLSDEGTDKAGRFYWPGLAAFAAKQVVEGIEYANENIDFWSLNFRSKAAFARAAAANTFYYLLKGNFWVFIEVVPWMTYYKRHGRESFDCCVDQRDVATYNPEVKRQMHALPWAPGKNVSLERSLQSRVAPIVGPYRIHDHAGALAEVDNCRATAPLKAGFAQMKRAENIDDPLDDARLKALYRSAESFLNHEQRLRLQRLVYDHPEFRSAISTNDFFRRWAPASLGARTPELIFNSEATLTDDIIRNELEPARLKPEDVSESMSLDDGSLYNEDERMAYVARILDRYHRLMTKKTDYMLDQLRAIARWQHA